MASTIQYSGDQKCPRSRMRTQEEGCSTATRKPRDEKNRAYRCRLGVVGRSHRTGAVERRARRPRLPLFRNHGGSNHFRRAGAQAPRSIVSGVRHLSRRSHAGSPAGLHQAWHPDRDQPGLDQPGCGGRTHRLLAEEAGGERHQGRNGQRQPDHRSRVAAHRQNPGKRQTDVVPDQQPGFRGGLSRRGADRRSAWAGSADRCHRPRSRSVYLHGADDARIRLGCAGPRPPRCRQWPRPFDGVRRASHRRLFRGSRIQGCPGAVEPGVSDRRRRGRRFRACSPRCRAPAARST